MPKFKVTVDIRQVHEVTAETAEEAELIYGEKGEMVYETQFGNEVTDVEEVEE